MIEDNKEKYYQIGTQLPPPKKKELLSFLKGNLDIFSWSAYGAPGVDPKFICHSLNVNPNAVPRR